MLSRGVTGLQWISKFAQQRRSNDVTLSEDGTPTDGSGKIEDSGDTATPVSEAPESTAVSAPEVENRPKETSKSSPSTKTPKRTKVNIEFIERKCVQCGHPQRRWNVKEAYTDGTKITAEIECTVCGNKITHTFEDLTGGE
jgi:DNA-directed RNA polymerase subunit M/transcription elongation factor TFIIS